MPDSVRCFTDRERSHTLPRMPDQFTPRFGARFHLDRIAITDESAVYGVTIFLPAAQHKQRVTIRREGGECMFEEISRTPAEDPDLQPWMTKYLRALARQIYRAGTRDGTWQMRLMRWHGSDEEEGASARMAAAAGAPGTGEPATPPESK